MNIALSIVARTSLILAGTALWTGMWHRGSASARHALWVIGLSAVLILPLAVTVPPGIHLPILPIPKTEIQAVQTSRAPGAEISSISKPEAVAAMTRLVRPTGGVQWLAIAWSLGGIAILFRWLFGVLEMRDLRRNSQTATDSKWHELLSEVRGDLSVRSSVELRIGGDSIPPMMWGIFRPTILFPSSAAGWTVDRLRLVLAHELAHVKRQDRLTQILVQWTCVVYWFNPLVWYAAYRMRIERERACDDHVLNTGEDAGDYANHLFQIAREASYRGTFAAVSMVTQLESRLRAILDDGKDRRTLSRSAAAMLACFVAVLTLLIATTQLTARPQASEPKWAGLWVMNCAKSTLVDLSGQLMACPVQSETVKFETVPGGIKETVDFEMGGQHTHMEVILQDGKAVSAPPSPTPSPMSIKDLVLKQISDYAFDVTIDANPGAPVPSGTVHAVVSPDGKTLTVTNTVNATISVLDREQ